MHKRRKAPGQSVPAAAFAVPSRLSTVGAGVCAKAVQLAARNAARNTDAVRMLLVHNFIRIFPSCFWQSAALYPIAVPCFLQPVFSGSPPISFLLTLLGLEERC